MVIRVLDTRAAQQPLRVAAEADLLQVAVIVHIEDSVQIVESCHARVGAHPDRVITVNRLDLVDRAVKHLSALEDHEDAVAQPFGDRHVVRRENHRRPITPKIENGVLEDLGIDGVKPREGLIQDQELGPAEHGGDELNLLRHAFGQGVNSLVEPGREPHPLEPVVDRPVELGLACPLQRPK